MTVNEEYKGHNILISVSEIRGGWSWNYIIDGEHWGELKDRPAGAESIALGEALHDAKFKIDQMKK